MNIAHRAYLFFALIAGLGCIGCQGLQGVRYHDADMIKAVGEDGMPVADAGFALGMAEADASGATGAPHPRFHPVPTRPVFEPEGVVATAAAPMPVESEPITPAITHTPAARETNISDAPSVLTSLAEKATPLPAGTKGEDDKQETESNDESVAGSSSRRQVEDDPANEEVGSSTKPSVEQATSREDDKEVITATHDEPPAFTPVKTKAPSSNDMWRPRVGN